MADTTILALRLNIGQSLYARPGSDSPPENVIHDLAKNTRMPSGDADLVKHSVPLLLLLNLVDFAVLQTASRL
ncbi:hypothetical protein E4U58_002265 [Claviceps cyperi]|nr:hypothetical protein E4U58_002265 [Claviceps cyperi]